jgi:hypothetical protein
VPTRRPKHYTMKVQPCRAGTVHRPTRRASVDPGIASKKVKEEQSEIPNQEERSRNSLQESLKFMNTSNAHKSNPSCPAPWQRRTASIAPPRATTAARRPVAPHSGREGLRRDVPGARRLGEGRRWSVASSQGRTRHWSEARGGVMRPAPGG